MTSTLTNNRPPAWTGSRQANEGPLSGSRSPLTPALSPREREQPGPALEHSHTGGFVERLTRIPPLPAGEGRGEGKRDARNAGGTQKLKLRCLALLVAVLALLFSLGALARGERDRSFDADWKFLRADAPGAERPDFDDSDWRTLEVPHDWSIEDLPPAGKTVDSFAVVEGQWHFHQGDDPAWKNPVLNDSEWQEVQLPDNWRHHSAYIQDNAYGWFRRHIQLPVSAEAKGVELLLGKIRDVDETYLNGVRIGGTGSFPPDFQPASDDERRYRVPAHVAHGDGTDVVAVRVFVRTGNGGIYDAGSPVGRAGPFDPGASPGGASTGHVLGGTGWYRKHFRLDAADAGKAVSVRFDGVYMDADVLGERPVSGQSPLWLHQLRPRVDPASQPCRPGERPGRARAQRRQE